MSDVHLEYTKIKSYEKNLILIKMKKLDNIYNRKRMGTLL